MLNDNISSMFDLAVICDGYSINLILKKDISKELNQYFLMNDMHID